MVAEKKDTMIGRKKGPWSWAGELGDFALMCGRDDKTGAVNPVDSDFLNAATAASITGFVRAYLMRHIDALEKAGAVILYCDTDSIVYQLDKPLEEHPVKFGKKLGEWGYEGRFSHGAIAGKKLYAFHKDEATYAEACAKAKKNGAEEMPTPWKKANKGVKLEAEQIMAIARGEKIRWEADAPIVSPLRKRKKGEDSVKAKFMHRVVKIT